MIAEQEQEVKELSLDSILPTGPYIIVDNGEYDGEVYRRYFEEEKKLMDKLSERGLPEKMKKELMGAVADLRATYNKFSFEDQKRRFDLGVKVLKVSPDIKDSSTKLMWGCQKDGEVFVYVDLEAANGRFKSMRVEDMNLLFVNINHVYGFRIDYTNDIAELSKAI